MDKLFIKLGLCVLYIINFLPYSIIRSLGNFLGLIGYFTFIKRRNIGLKNLTLCFPEMSLKTKQSIIKEHFKFLLTSGLEYSFLFFASEKKIKTLVKIKNIEIVNKYYKKHPIILLCPHFVGLELAASRLSQDFSGCSMYSIQKNSYLTEQLKNARLRFMKNKGGKIFSRSQGLRPIIKKLRFEKEIFYYLPDQDLGERDSIYVPFFAHPYCATVNVLPKLVTLTNAIVIPLVVYKKANIYEVEFLEPWENYPCGNEFEDIVRMNKFIESVVLKHMSQYFWLHKRFKSQPNTLRGQIYNHVK